MSNNNNRDNNENRNGLENEHRIEHLRNIVEKQTRTERHLEENADISKSRENIAHVKELQKERENEIQNLTDIIAYGNHNNNKQLENTEKRYEYTNGYLEHNAEHMDREDIINTKIKQEHRKEEIDNLK